MSDETELRTVYTTRHEAIEREIIGAFSHEPTDDYDIDGIADEVLEWVVDRDELGREIVSEGHVGYRLRDITDEQFWAIAARHDRTAPLEAARTAYSDAREQRRAAVLAAVRAGMTKVRVSELSGVSRPAIDKWLED